MKKTHINKLRVIMTIPVLALSVFGCSDPEYPTPVPATAAPTTSGNILVINAVPDAPVSFDVFVNNVKAGATLTKDAVFPGYAKTPVGQAAVRASATTGKIGGTLDAASVLYRAGATNQNNFSFGNNLFYTFIITDSIARPKPTTLNATNPGGPQFLTFTDNLGAPAAGSAKVRFIHLAPGAPAVYVTKASGTALSTFTNQAYRGTATSNTFQAVTAGTTNIEVRTTSVTGSVIAQKTSFDFVAGKIYTIFLSGKRVGTTVKVPYAVNVVTHN